MNSLLGHLSAFAWFMLAAVTAVGTLIEGKFSSINLVMAATFSCIAAFLSWRTTTVANVRRSHPDSHDVKKLMVIEAISSSVVLLLGLGCVGAALLRVFSEGVPVFG